jgi:hypothetical protein
MCATELLTGSLWRGTLLTGSRWQYRPDTRHPMPDTPGMPG